MNVAFSCCCCLVSEVGVYVVAVHALGRTGWQGTFIYLVFSTVTGNGVTETMVGFCLMGKVIFPFS